MDMTVKSRWLLSAIGSMALFGCTQGAPQGYHAVSHEKAPVSSTPADDADASPVPTESGAPAMAVQPPSDAGEQPSRPTESEPNVAATQPGSKSGTSDVTPDASESPAASGKKPFDITQLTAEQQMAVLRAQALGEPLPDFTKLDEPREIKLLIPEKDFSIEGPENLIRISFDDIDLLKVLNMEPVPANAVDYFPEWLKSLDGKRVILRGWMFPPGRTEKISKFMFVRDNGICCFQRKPKVYDKLGVTMREGHTTNYIEGRPFDVVATLRLAPDVIEGNELFWLYFLDDAVVLDKKS